MLILIVIQVHSFYLTPSLAFLLLFLWFFAV